MKLPAARRHARLADAQSHHEQCLNPSRRPSHARYVFVRDHAAVAVYRRLRLFKMDGDDTRCRGVSVFGGFGLPCA